jgi:hypothetical protein
MRITTRMQAASDRERDELKKLEGEYASRGMGRSGGYVAAVLNARTTEREAQCEAIADDLLGLVQSYATLTAESAEWVYAEVAKVVDGNARGIESAISDLAVRISAPPTTSSAFAERVSRWASRYKSRLHLRINEVAKRAELTASIAVPGPTPVQAVERRGDLLIEAADRAVIEALRVQVPQAANCYDQAVRDLTDEQRVSWRGTANELREALRETLSALAPAEEVMKQPWFKPERQPQPGINPGPTMRQRARYILRKNGAADDVTATVDATVGLIEEQYAALVRAIYDRASSPAHAPRTSDDVKKLHSLIRVALGDLLRA